MSNIPPTPGPPIPGGGPPVAAGPMDDMQIDWDSTLQAHEEMQDFTALPADTYMVRVDTAEVMPPSKAGNPMIKLQMSVIGGAYNGRLLFDRFVWMVQGADDDKLKKSRGMFMVKLVAFGISREWVATNRPSMVQIAQVLTGQSAMAQVTVGSYQGSPTNDVGRYTPISIPGVPSAVNGAVAPPVTMAGPGGATVPVPMAPPAPAPVQYAPPAPAPVAAAPAPAAPYVPPVAPAPAPAPAAAAPYVPPAAPPPVAPPPVAPVAEAPPPAAPPAAPPTEPHTVAPPAPETAPVGPPANDPF